LNDADNGADAERQVEQFCQKWWTRFIGYVKREVKERLAKKQQESATERAARRTAWATVWIAFFTFVSITVSGGTLWVLRLQLKEIHDSSSDTHTLAQAADTQAKKMADMSTAAEKIRLAAENMVIQDQRIADNAQKTMDASNRQSKAVLDATIGDFQRDQRAWVGFSESNVIKFDDKEPFQLLITFVNSGKSPAVQDEGATNYSIDENAPSGPIANPGYSFEKTGAIPPQGKYLLRITNSAVPPRYDAISSGKQFLKFSGQFKYHDVYRPDVVHTTSFCLYYERQTKTMSFCYTGNDMD
jgi:hypothetical protein